MGAYSHVLFATDFSPESEAAGRKATEIAALTGARLSLLHVVEYSAMEYAGEIPIPENIDLDQRRIELARGQIAELAQRLGVAGAPTFAALAPELVELLRDADLGGFGISRLDLRMLQAELQRANVALDLAAARMVDAQVIFHRREPRDLTAALAFYRGKTLEGAHGAEADTLASLEVFAGQLDRYADLESDVEALNVLTTQLNANYVDRGRKFAWRDGEPVFNFGKLRGKPLRAAASEPSERGYLRWIANGPFDDEVKILVQEALAGRIRRREA